MLFYYLFHHMLVFNLHCQLVLRISGNTNMLLNNPSQRRILIVPEVGWFGQPKYSQYTFEKNILRRFLALYSSFYM